MLSGIIDRGDGYRAHSQPDAWNVYNEHLPLGQWLISDYWVEDRNRLPR